MPVSMKYFAYLLPSTRLPRPRDNRSPRPTVCSPKSETCEFYKEIWTPVRVYGIVFSKRCGGSQGSQIGARVLYMRRVNLFPRKHFGRPFWNFFTKTSPIFRRRHRPVLVNNCHVSQSETLTFHRHEGRTPKHQYSTPYLYF